MHPMKHIHDNCGIHAFGANSDICAKHHAYGIYDIHDTLIIHGVVARRETTKTLYSCVCV